MRVQETHLEETLCSKNMQDVDTTDELEEEETLSLCDLPLYSDQSADWDQDFSINSNSTGTTTSSSHEADYFEFFIQELSPSSGGGLPPENIIFCGKLISTYKHLSPSNQAHEVMKNSVPTKHSQNSRWRWKVSPKGTTTLMHRRQRYNTNKKLGKAKWYFYLFGISRFSPVVELSDIRSRQSRRHSRSSSSPPPSMMMFGFRKGDECDKVKDVSGRGWGLWTLIMSALSCGGNHLTATVAMVAEGGCTPA